MKTNFIIMAICLIVSIVDTQQIFSMAAAGRTAGQQAVKYGQQVARRTYSDFHKTAQLPDTATKQEIQASWRKLAKEFHPDVATKNGTSKTQATEKFQDLSNSYDKLKNSNFDRATYEAQYGSKYNSQAYNGFKWKQPSAQEEESWKSAYDRMREKGLSHDQTTSIMNLMIDKIQKARAARAFGTAATGGIIARAYDTTPKPEYYFGDDLYNIDIVPFSNLDEENTQISNNTSTQEQQSPVADVQPKTEPTQPSAPKIDLPIAHHPSMWEQLTNYGQVDISDLVTQNPLIFATIGTGALATAGYYAYQYYLKYFEQKNTKKNKKKKKEVTQE